jgi:hypothetical protein
MTWSALRMGDGIVRLERTKVEPTGIEPVTFRMPLFTDSTLSKAEQPSSRDAARDAAALVPTYIIASAPHVDPKNVAAGWGSFSYKISLLASFPVLLVK